LPLSTLLLTSFATLLQDEPASPLVQGLVGYALATVFALVGAGCVFVVVLGLPGTWILLLLAGAMQLTDGFWRHGDAHTFSWWTLGIAAGLALLGEALEFMAGMAGAKKGGASKRGMVGALIGGVVGAIVGAALLAGIGALPGGFLGSALGAIVGELTHPHMTLEKSLKPATGAAAGRLAGTMLKLVLALILWIGLSVAAFVP
jgi:uncharacterized protein YqgC (DUF456 family)